MNKVFKVAIISMPILIAFGSVGIYFGIATKRSNSRHKKYEDVNQKVIDDIYSKYNIFPILEQHDFYNLIHISKTKAIIDDEMISKVINYVIRHMEIAEGNIKYGYERISMSEVIFTFKWISPSKVFTKNYHFDILQYV